MQGLLLFSRLKTKKIANAKSFSLEFLAAYQNQFGSRGLRVGVRVEFKVRVIIMLRYRNLSGF